MVKLQQNSLIFTQQKHQPRSAYTVPGSTKTEKESKSERERERESNLNRKDRKWARENSVGSTLQALNMDREF